MMINPVNLQHKLSLFNQHWSPKIIAQMNDYHLKLAKIQGEFTWHSHPETDELFLVVSGQMTIQLRDGEVTLSAAELCVVPRGVEHRPVAQEECAILLIEPAGTLNTGDAASQRPSTAGEWI